MKWRGKNKYCIQCGAYRITKTLHSSEPLYSLYHTDETIGIYHDADEARSAASDHQRRGAAQAGD